MPIQLILRLRGCPCRIGNSYIPVMAITLLGWRFLAGRFSPCCAAKSVLSALALEPVINLILSVLKRVSSASSSPC